MKKMKTKHILYGCLLGGAMLVSSCSDFTDVQPKGKNLLSTTTQLEMLLNREFYMSSGDGPQFLGDLITTLNNVPNLLSQPTPTRTSIILEWDASLQDRLAELTASDDEYDSYYGVIGQVANPILSHIDAATGDPAVKNQLRCEALTLRAYFHYLVVNKFAKAYNPATAAEDPGVPYVLETQDVAQPTVKMTVQEVYDHILADVQEAIDLDGMPTVAVNRMRMSKPCAYAVKALALLSMQRFDEAEEAARQALALNGAVDNYYEMLTTSADATGNPYNVLLRPQLECQEDMFFTYYMEYFEALTPESMERFEPGYATLELIDTDKKMYAGIMPGMATSMLGLDDRYIMTMDLSSGWNMAGLRTTQMYLIVAEAEIHKGNYAEAMHALDAIRVNRLAPETYQPLEGTVTTEADAIRHLKQVSHGENIYSVYNFIHRKRWNQVSGWEETFTKTLAGNTYTLTPDSPLWIFPFGQNVLSNNPNITQNYK